MDVDVADNAPETLYIELIKKLLTGTLLPYEIEPSVPKASWANLLARVVKRAGSGRGIVLARYFAYDPNAREDGSDLPLVAETMTGLKRMNVLQECVIDVLRNDVPGDFIECGVWRGGSSIFMRAILKAYRETGRKVWLADSFAGPPPPDPENYPADKDVPTDWDPDAEPDYEPSLKSVKANFEKYGLLDNQVGFLEGYFKDTLPDAPVDRLAIARLDGDLYESTIQALDALYPKLSAGGYMIIDDYGAYDYCEEAVQDYRKEHGIDDEIHTIDWTGAYWQKTG